MCQVDPSCVQKKTSSSSTTQPKPVTAPAPSVQSAKKRAGLKSKAKARPGAQGESVLGGADYVTLLLGGRRKAAEEALKL